MTRSSDPGPGRWIPSKAWGQNYLVNAGVIDKIVSLVPPGTAGVIEIGAGRGALTGALLAQGHRVLAVEPHPESVRFLADRFGDEAGFSLLEADATSLDFATLSPPANASTLPGPIAVVGNLPYCVAARILFNLVRTGRGRGPWILMFQREVAQRIVAAPGSRDYGLLSVIAQLATACRLCFHVAPGSFSPVPKVTSSVVRFDPLDLSAPPDWEALSSWLSRLFSRRRKQLGNSLAALLSPERAAELRTAGELRLAVSGATTTVTLDQRPEQLAPAVHLALFEAWGL